MMEQAAKLLESPTDVDNESCEDKSRQSKVDCSHRVIEKRRRDRINNSLMQLSKLVPIENFNKKNSGKLEKAEILELTVHYLTQQQLKSENESEKRTHDDGPNQEIQSCETQEKDLPLFLRGFKQCISDATKFFQDVEELDVSEGRCYRLIQHLKRQTSRYEKKERNVPNTTAEDRLIWDVEESCDVSNVRAAGDVNHTKRKNLDVEGTPLKKPRNSETNDGDETCVEQEPCSNPDPTNNVDPRNYMPFVFPNIPMFTTLPFPGSNNIPRFQGSQPQFPGYQYQQSSPQYIPVALPQFGQFPVMGMNFVPSFGMMNGEQSQNGGLPTPAATAPPIHSGVPTNGMPGLMPTGIPNGFFPSMYTNGIHADIMAMRPRDSGYESSEKSSSSKGSASETSPQSFSDDSCQSYAA